MKHTRKMTLSVLLMLVMLLGMIPAMAIPARAATYNVASLTELQTVLSTATSETEIIVTALISLPNGTVLDGHGATVRVTTPYLNEDGKTVSGYSTINVFSISSGTVTLRNMTIMGGFAGTNREFGAVRVSGSGTKLQMDNVTLTRSGRGLSIVDGSVAVLRNCNIVRNMNMFGGGIQCCNNSTLIMDACSFSENRAYYYGGGAMEIQESKMYANNTVICNNSTQSNGGALHAYGASIYLLNCTMSGNVTGGNSPQGAGIGTNSAGNKNSIYAANCVLMNNYRIPGGNKTPVECDFGYINPQKGQHGGSHGV